MKVKVLVLTLLIIILFTATVFAEKPVIRADQSYFDVNTGLYMLKGNVYIEVKSRVITAGQAKVNLATLEVWGADGVSVTQNDLSFTGDSVYVYGTKDRASICGGVNLTRPGLTILADKVDYNWRSRLATFSGNVQITQNGNSWSADCATYNIETNSFVQ